LFNYFESIYLGYYIVIYKNENSQKHNKMSKVRMYSIDSRDRTYGTNEDFYYTIPPINCKKFQLVEAILPNSWYNINEGSSFIFDEFVVQGGPYTVDLPVGIYLTTDDIANHIQNEMRISSPIDYTVMFNQLIGRFIITSPLGESTFKLRFTDKTEQGSANMAWQILGYDKPPTDGFYETPLTQSKTSPHVAQVDGENYLLIDSNLAIQGFSKPSHQGVLTKIQIDQNGGDVIYHRVADDIFDVDQQLTTLNFKLMWYDNTVLNLNGRSWSLLIKLFYD
jgi:hypothetical protein